MTQERLFELWNEVEHLDQLARRLPENHAVHAAMRAALDLPEDALPQPEKLYAAKEAFYGMNPAMLSVALAGWHPQWLREERSALAAQFRATVGVTRVLEVIPDCGGDRGRPLVCQTFELRDDLAPVRVVIREGASLCEVIRGLEDATALLRDEWHSLINGMARTERVRGELMGREPRRKKARVAARKAAAGTQAA
jgi:hypothetical protein